MRRHNRIDARRNRFAERCQLDLVQPLLPVRDAGQAAVGVHCRIPVARKMLGRRDHALGLIAAYRRGSLHGHSIRTFSERTYADHRVRRIVVDVDTRRKVKVDAELQHLLRRQPRHFLRQRRIIGCP
ncbi:hypothetical protein D3C81_890430 [compost metagenome]